MTPARTLALGATLLAAAGCASKRAADYSRLACTRDSDCGPAETCFEDGCGDATAFAVRVTPMDDNGLPPQDFNPVSVALSRMDLALQPAGALQGTLRISQGGVLGDYPAQDGRSFTIQARGRSSVIANLPFDRPVEQLVRAGANFSLAVPPGYWDVTATASDTTLPPVFAGQVLVPANDAVDPKLTLIGDPLLQIEGHLLKDVGIPWPPTPPKFRFQVFDSSPGTRLPLSQTAGPVLGGDVFRVFALRTGGRVLLRASPDATVDGPVPTKDFFSDEQGRFDRFVFGDYGPPVVVRGRVVDQGGAPVANAQVLIQGLAKGGGTLTVRSTTDASGDYTATLLESRSPQGPYPAEQYQFLAYPPSDSSAAPGTLWHGVSASESMPTQTAPTLTCGAKVRLGGRVVDGTGRPLANVTVHYEGNASALSPGRSAGDVKTGGSGEFAALVDPGEYRVMAKPSFERTLPWATRRVSATGPTELVLEVSAARLVYGTVTSRTGDGTLAPIPNALVRVYRVPALTGGETADAPALLYEVLSDANGSFRAVVPRAAGAE